MLNVTLYTRKGCKLCDEVKAELNELQSQYPHRLVEVDIESDAALMAKFWVGDSCCGSGTLQPESSHHTPEITNDPRRCFR